MAKTSPPKRKTPPPPSTELAETLSVRPYFAQVHVTNLPDTPSIPLATPESSRPSDYPASMGESRVARIERKLDEALEKLADAQERLRRIDRRSRHLD